MGYGIQKERYRNYMNEKDKFQILVAIFEELHGEIKKRTPDNPGKVHIFFYISKSLCDEMSVNAKEFLGFCQSCMGIKFELILMEMLPQAL